MTPEQIKLIQESFKRVPPITDEFAATFYNRLFKIAPDTIPLFKGDMTEQGRKLLTMLGVVVNGLNDLEAIVPAAQKMAIQHKGYGVKPQHYDAVGEALMWSFGQAFPGEFTLAHLDAWTSAYGVLATTMIDAAEKDGGAAEAAKPA